MKNKKTLTKKPTKFLKVLKSIGLILVSLIIVGFIYEQISEYIDAKTLKAPGQMIQVGDHKIHIYCTGENINGNPTIVMIPGAGSSYFTFFKIQPTLSKYTKVCSYDPAGFGFSEGASDGRTAKDTANELKLTLDNANIEGPYLIVGHSLGGAYAQVFAKDNIKSIIGMVLIDSSCVEQAEIKDPPIPFFINAINNAISSAFYVGLPRLAMTISPEAMGLHRDNGKIERSIVAKPFRETNKTSILTGALNSVEQVKQASNFDNLPITILEADGSQKQATELWGDKIGQCHKKMAAFSASAKYILVQNSEHFIQDDQPQVVIDAIKEMLK
ncbi:MAG: alpha/beta hydrolase [bacterium]